MDASQISNAVASALVVVTSGGFMVTYHLRAPWRSTPYGRHLMAVAAAVGGLGLYTVVTMIWPGTVPALRVVRIVLLVAVAALMVQRTVMVIRLQRRGG